MTLAKPTVTGGDFLNLKELAADGPVLAVFRIRAFEDPEPGDYGYPKVPVIADVLICSGPRKGEVHLKERHIGAPTAALRGVKNPTVKDPTVLPPTTKVGDEIAARIAVVSKKGANPFVGLDQPSDVEFAAIAEVHANGAGWGAAPAAQSAAPAASSGRPPWASDGEPGF
jgi:hypothetical protein